MYIDQAHTVQAHTVRVYVHLRIRMLLLFYPQIARNSQKIKICFNIHL
jgi:hypothetical protein